MSHTFEELKKKTVAELREIAKELEHEAVKGYTQLNKEHLLAALCEALNIEKCKKHKAAAAGTAAEVKAEIRELKVLRDQAIAAKNKQELKKIRRRMHRLKRASRQGAIA